VKRLEIREDHVRVKDVRLDTTEYRREDRVENRPGRKVTQSISLPAVLSGVFLADDALVGALQIDGKILDGVHQHLSANRLARFDNQLLGFNNLVTEHVLIYLYAKPEVN